MSTYTTHAGSVHSWLLYLVHATKFWVVPVGHTALWSYLYNLYHNFFGAGIKQKFATLV